MGVCTGSIAPIQGSFSYDRLALYRRHPRYTRKKEIPRDLADPTLLAWPAFGCTTGRAGEGFQRVSFRSQSWLIGPYCLLVSAFGINVYFAVKCAASENGN